MKPKTQVERAMAGEIPWSSLGTLPHCDGRVLHMPHECTYCADATELQEERTRLSISNTGHQNRLWPCPADQARSAKSLNSWHGNVPMTEERAKQDQEDWDKFAEELRKLHGATEENE
jgi:hypothetical protein